MSKNRTYRTINDMDEAYYRAHPDEIDSYLATVFEEHAKDGHTPALLSSLRMIARVKGVSFLAEHTGITRNGIQKALSEDAKPGFDTISTIVRAMGYCLTPQRIEMQIGQS
jgi:probable addiction module antidote protein